MFLLRRKSDGKYWNRRRYSGEWVDSPNDAKAFRRRSDLKQSRAVPRYNFTEECPSYPRRNSDACWCGNCAACKHREVQIAVWQSQSREYERRKTRFQGEMFDSQFEIVEISYQIKENK